jgi:hypothetical protein
MNEMTQLILTYAILTLVTGYVVYKLRKTLFPKKEESVGCGSGCGCDAVKLKKEILNSDKTSKRLH